MSTSDFPVSSGEQLHENPLLGSPTSFDYPGMSEEDKTRQNNRLYNVVERKNKNEHNRTNIGEITYKTKKKKIMVLLNNIHKFIKYGETYRRYTTNLKRTNRDHNRNRQSAQQRQTSIEEAYPSVINNTQNSSIPMSSERISRDVIITPELCFTVPDGYSISTPESSMKMGYNGEFIDFVFKLIKN